MCVYGQRKQSALYDAFLVVDVVYILYQLIGLRLWPLQSYSSKLLICPHCGVVGSTEVTQLLLEAGAVRDKENNIGKTASQLAGFVGISVLVTGLHYIRA